jgi:tetratricopeptide (TPR) repeat protein
MQKLVWCTVAFLGIVCAALWRGAVFAKDALWETCMKAAVRSQQQGRPAEAARMYEVAIRRAQRFGSHDARLVTSLTGLADLYRQQGDAQKAEPLYLQALALGEKSLGLNHPTVAACRTGLAALRQARERGPEAADPARRPPHALPALTATPASRRTLPD